MNKRWLYHGTMYTWRELLLIVATLALVSGCTSTPEARELRQLDASIIKHVTAYFDACKTEGDSEACSDANRAKVNAVMLAVLQRRSVAHRHLVSRSIPSNGYAWVLEQQRKYQQQPRTHREMMCAANPFEC